MERIRSIGTDTEHNGTRIRNLEAWVREHEKVKSRHERYMAIIAILAILSILIHFI